MHALLGCTFDSLMRRFESGTLFLFSFHRIPEAFGYLRIIFLQYHPSHINVYHPMDIHARPGAVHWMDSDGDYILRGRCRRQPGLGYLRPL